MGFSDGVEPAGKNLGIAVNFIGPFAAGVAPIIIPHKNKARYVILSDASIRQDAYSATPYQVLETYLNYYSVHTPIYLHRRDDIQDIHHYTHIHDIRRQEIVDDVTHYPLEQRHIHGPREIHTDIARHYHHWHVYDPLTHVDTYIPAGERVSNYVQPTHMLHNRTQFFSQSQQIPLYEVIETNNTTLLAGLIAFVSAGPLALGGGLIGQGHWQVTSRRLIPGRDTAYTAKELDSPKSAADILSWPYPYTNVSWLAVRGVKAVAGLYMVAHVGAVVDLEGVWEHRVIRERKEATESSPAMDVITIAMSLKKQGRLKATAGVVPFLSGNKDVVHAAKTHEIKFKFNNIYADSRLIPLLDKLLKDMHHNAVLEAKAIADEYAAIGLVGSNAPLEFAREFKRSDHESRNRLRARLPLIANIQTVAKKRRREEVQTFFVAGQPYEKNVQIVEITKRKEFQYPIEAAIIEEDSRIYPNRVGIDYTGSKKWPLDYRNKYYEETTQVRESSEGDLFAPYEVGNAKYLWVMNDNYTSREKFLEVLNRIGKQTGLQPILAREWNIPEFDGPLRRDNSYKETMQISLLINLKKSDQQQIFDNLLKQDRQFVPAVMRLFDSYVINPNGDYLGFTSGSQTLMQYSENMRHALEEQAKKLVNKARKVHKSLYNDRKHPKLGLLSSHISKVERMEMTADLLNRLKINPFIFLAGLDSATPNCSLAVHGTGVSIERVIEIALARDIMLNQAMLPNIYMEPDDAHEYVEGPKFAFNPYE